VFEGGGAGVGGSGVRFGQEKYVQESWWAEGGLVNEVDGVGEGDEARKRGETERVRGRDGRGAVVVREGG